LIGSAEQQEKAIMSRLTAWLLAVALVAGLSPMVAASTIRDDVSDALYTSLAAQPAYAGVGMIVKTTGSGSFLSSGTLISPDWVLTAAHVVSNATGATFTINGSKYTADSWSYCPTFDSSTYNDDIGLMHLSTPVTSVASAGLYPGTISDLLGQTATFVGYGATGTGLSGYSTSNYGTKRAVQNVLDTTADVQQGSSYSTSTLISDFDNPHSALSNVTGNATPLSLEGLIALGDSGGGMFVTIGGATYLAGVNSVLLAPDGTFDASYGDLSGCVGVPSYVGWIASVSGVTPVPEPSGLAMWLGLVAAWFLGRRSRFPR
jgi:hypothetical protein